MFLQHTYVRETCLLTVHIEIANKLYVIDTHEGTL